ncbi:MAG: alkaline phosphatase [Planctomycetota bacterium]
MLLRLACLAGLAAGGAIAPKLFAQEAADIARSDDPLRTLQSESVKSQRGIGHHWGTESEKFTTWGNHSNRLIPVYTYGVTLNQLRDRGSAYADTNRLKKLYGRVPANTHNPVATFFDQTELYDLQVAALDAGCTQIIVMVFDGMDWQTTRAAAVYDQPEKASQAETTPYTRGRGAGLSFQTYRGAITDFGWVATSSYSGGATFDVNTQLLQEVQRETRGGYDEARAGRYPWMENSHDRYLIGLDGDEVHAVTDSAASASAIFSGLKTFNGSINVAPDGERTESLARKLQREMDWRIGVVSSVPVSHATPASVYANNVTRQDYQDIARDLIGLPSSSHPDDPLSGVDVLIGGGYGEGKGRAIAQGENFKPGNAYLHQDDMRKVDVKQGGKYVVVTRREGASGATALAQAARAAADDDHRLLGFFGAKGGNLPFQTADGQYNPTFDTAGAMRYSPADVSENPTLADMTRAALTVLENSVEGFYLAIEAGDVDWANHANNLDNSIGAVLSGDAAFRVVTDWIEENNAWDQTAVIVTADHGHFLVIDDAQQIAAAGRRAAQAKSWRRRVQQPQGGQ